MIFLTILIVFIYNSNFGEPVLVKNFEPIVLIGTQSGLTQAPKSSFQSSIEDESSSTVKTADEVRTSLQVLSNDLTAEKNTDVMIDPDEFVISTNPTAAEEDDRVVRDNAVQGIDLKRKVVIY